MILDNVFNNTEKTTVYHCTESCEADHYHVVPVAENSMLPALTAPLWSQKTKCADIL